MDEPLGAHTDEQTCEVVLLERNPESIRSSRRNGVVTVLVEDVREVGGRTCYVHRIATETHAVTRSNAQKRTLPKQEEQGNLTEKVQTRVGTTRTTRHVDGMERVVRASLFASCSVSASLVGVLALAR